jgi:hypothetical protein
MIAERGYDKRKLVRQIKLDSATAVLAFLEARNHSHSYFTLNSRLSH